MIVQFTMLTATMLALFVALLLGAWLSSLYLLREEPPKGLITGLVHGTAGATTIVLLWLALRATPHRVPAGLLRGLAHPSGHGAGGFGWTSFTILALTFAGGLLILFTHMRRRPISPLLIAMHATAGIAGAVILAAYWASPASYGR